MSKCMLVSLTKGERTTQQNTSARKRWTRVTDKDAIGVSPKRRRWTVATRHILTYSCPIWDTDRFPIRDSHSLMLLRPVAAIFAPRASHTCMRGHPPQQPPS